MIYWRETAKKELSCSQVYDIYCILIILWIDIIDICSDVNGPNELFGIMGNISFSYFDAPGIKGLIIKNAQGISLGTFFKNYHKHASYNKSQRKKLYPPKPGSAKFRPLAPAKGPRRTSCGDVC